MTTTHNNTINAQNVDRRTRRVRIDRNKDKEALHRNCDQISYDMTKETVPEDILYNYRNSFVVHLANHPKLVELMNFTSDFTVLSTVQDDHLARMMYNCLDLQYTQYVSYETFLFNKYPIQFIELRDGKYYFRSLTVHRSDLLFAITKWLDNRNPPPLEKVYPKIISTERGWHSADDFFFPSYEESAVPQSFSSNIKDTFAFAKDIPKREERDDWATLLTRLVDTLNVTNTNVNTVVTTSCVAIKEMSDIHDTFRNLVGQLSDGELKNSLVGIIGKMDKTMESISKNSDKVGNVLEAGAQRLTGVAIIDNMVRESGKVSIFLFFVTLLMHIKYNNIHTFTSCIGVAALLFMQGKHKAWILSQFSALIILFPNTNFSIGSKREKEDHDDNSAVPQMNAEDLEGAFSLFTTMFLGYAAKGANLQEKSMAFLSNFKRVDGGVKEFGIFLKNFAEWVATQLRDIFSNEQGMPSVRFLKSLDSEYEKYASAVRSFCKGYNMKMIRASQTNLINLEALISLGEKLRRAKPRDKSTLIVDRALVEDLTALKAIRKAFENSNMHLNGFRQEPATLMFFGGPGTGKSKAVNEAAYAAVARSITVEEFADFIRNPSSRIYNRSAENVYWDGYVMGNIVCTFDDFGQAIDVAGQPDNEYMNFIRAANGFEYNLHMAGLELKGNTLFHSTYIVGSTNHVSLKANSIFQPEALERRIDRAYIVVPREEYLTEETKHLGLYKQKLDRNKLPIVEVMLKDGSRVKTTDLRTEHQWFYPRNSLGDPCGEPLTFEQVLKEWFEVHDRKAAEYEQNMLSFKKTFSDYASEYPNISNSPDLDMDELETAVPQSGQTNFKSEYVKNMSESQLYPHLTDWVLHNKPYWKVNIPNLKTCSHVELLEFMEMSQAEADVSFETWVYSTTNFMIKFKHKVLSLLGIADQYILEKFPFLAKITSLPIEHFVIMPLIVTTVGAILYKLFDYVKNFFIKKGDVPESFGYSDKMKARAAVAKMYRTRHEHNASLKPQMGADVNGVNLMRSVVNKSMYDVQLQLKDGSWQRQEYCLNLEREYLLLPFHTIGTLVYEIAGNSEAANRLIKFVRVSAKGIKLEYTCTYADVVAGVTNDDLNSKDLVIVRLPDFRGAGSILKYIVPTAQLNQDQATINAALINMDAIAYFNATRHDKPKRVEHDEWGVSWEVRDYYSYDQVTQAGDCGSLLIKLNSKHTEGKIYGMHVAGSRTAGTGFASAFSREEIETSLEKAKRNFETVVPEAVKFAGDAVKVVRELESKEIPRYSYKNNIERSPLYGCVGPAKTDKSVMRPMKIDDKVIDPMSNAYAKYDIVHKTLDDEQISILKDVAQQYFEMQINVSNILRPHRILTVREALYGVKENEGLCSIHASTSPGWPMNLPASENWKKKLFPYDGSKEQEEYIVLYENRIEEMIKLYENGERLDFYYLDTLKAERRKLEKVSTASSRMFSAGPFDLLVLNRMFFGDFTQTFKRNRIKNWSGVGINPYSVDWNEVARHFARFDPIHQIKVGAGDYSGFDCTHNAQIHDIIVDMINRYYYNEDLENNGVRTLLFKEISNSKHVVENKVVQWSGSMPSGNFMTIEINCIYNAIAFGYGYQRIILTIPKQLNFHPGDFCKNVVLVVVGDDNVFTVHPDLRPYMNEITLPKFMAELGLKYTTELKETATLPFRNLTEVSFLKRTWEWDPLLVRYIAPIELDVALEICYWTQSVSDWKLIAAENVVNTLDELSLHSKSIWLKYAPTIISQAKKNYPGIKFSSPIDMPWERRRLKVLTLNDYYY